MNHVCVLVIGGIICNVAKLVEHCYLFMPAFVNTAGKQIYQSCRCSVRWQALGKLPWTTSPGCRGHHRRAEC